MSDAHLIFSGDEYWAKTAQTYVFDMALSLEDGAPVAADLDGIKKVLHQTILAVPGYWMTTDRERDFMRSLADSACELTVEQGGGIRMQVELQPGSHEQHRRFLEMMNSKAGLVKYFRPDSTVLHAARTRSGVIEFVERMRAMSAGRDWDGVARNKTWIGESLLGRLRGNGSGLQDGGATEEERARISNALSLTACEIGLWRGGVATSAEANWLYADVLQPQRLLAHYALGASLDWPAHESFIQVVSLLEDPQWGLDLTALRDAAQAPRLKPRLDAIRTAQDVEDELFGMESLATQWREAAILKPVQRAGLNALARSAYEEAAKVSHHVRAGELAPWDLFGFDPNFGDLVVEADRVVSAYDHQELSDEHILALGSTERAWRQSVEAQALLDGDARLALASACRCPQGFFAPAFTCIEVEAVRLALRTSTGRDYPPRLRTVAAILGDLADDVLGDWQRSIDYADALQRTRVEVARRMMEEGGDAFEDAEYGAVLRRAVDQVESLRGYMEAGYGELTETALAWAKLSGLIASGKWDAANAWQPIEFSEDDSAKPAMSDG